MEWVRRFDARIKSNMGTDFFFRVSTGLFSEEGSLFIVLRTAFYGYVKFIWELITASEVLGRGSSKCRC